MSENDKLKDLLQKHQDGSLDMQEEARLQSYLTDPNSDLNSLLEDLWLEEPSTRNDSPQIAEEFEAIQRRTQAPRSLPRKTNYLKYAASLVFASLALTAAYWYNQQDGKQNLSPTFTEKHTRADERVKIMLPDSSLVYLAHSSSLKWPNSFVGASSRTVYLEGEAFFEVAKNANKPFRIQSGSIITEVLGTSFNISAYAAASEYRVAVQTGMVSVSTAIDGNSKLLDILSAGKLLRYNKNTGGFKTLDIAPEHANSWITRRLNFQEASLTEVLSLLEQCYAVEFLLDPRVEQTEFRFNANFDKQSIAQIMKQLQLMSGGTLGYKIMNHGKIKIEIKED